MTTAQLLDEHSTLHLVHFNTGFSLIRAIAQLEDHEFHDAANVLVRTFDGHRSVTVEVTEIVRPMLEQLAGLYPEDTAPIDALWKHLAGIARASWLGMRLRGEA
jgi:hypothetical protein